MIIAIDTGGTKTLIAAFDESGKKTILERILTPRDKVEYVHVVSGIITRSVSSSDIDAIIIAVPGIIRGGIIAWCGNIGWEAFDMAAQLRKIFPNTPILLENDANLAGLGEVRSREDAPISCLYITISTGIGSGIITNGNIDPGLRLSEAGHALIKYDGVLQEWEAFASGKAIVTAYDKMAKDITSKKTWREIVDRISRGFLVLIPVIQPELIIIGGSVGLYFERYGTLLAETLQEKLPQHIPCPVIEQAHHPDEAVIYGCYYHALDKIITK